MTSKEYLGRAYRQKLKLESLQMQIEMIRTAAEQTGSMQYGERVSHSRNVAAMEDSVIRIMEKEELLRTESSELIRLLAENTDLINTLEDVRQRAILSRRYIGFESWENIAANMCYTERWVLKQHGLALELLDKREVLNGVS